MERDVISNCPVCESRLHVTRLHCNTCSTTIEGEFTVGRFARLGREQMSLLESFLRSRGNLRELERELGLSYPTVRGRVEALLQTLGFGEGSAHLADEPSMPAATALDADERRAVLERLARHEISADDAAAALRGEQPANVEEKDA